MHFGSVIFFIKEIIDPNILLKGGLQEYIYFLIEGECISLFSEINGWASPAGGWGYHKELVISLPSTKPNELVVSYDNIACSVKVGGQRARTHYA